MKNRAMHSLMRRKWAFAPSRTLSPEYVMRHHVDQLTPNEFGRAVLIVPHLALQCALGRLTQKQLVRCLSLAPDAGVKYLPRASVDDAAHAHYMTLLATHCPWDALMSLQDSLNDSDFATAVRGAPGAALYHAQHRLTQAQFAYAVAEEPGIALDCALDSLTGEQFAYAVNAEPAVALRTARTRMTSRQVATATAAIKAKRHRLGPDAD